LDEVGGVFGGAPVVHDREDVTGFEAFEHDVVADAAVGGTPCGGEAVPVADDLGKAAGVCCQRMERAEGGLKPLTVKALLMAYGVTDVGEIDAFLALSRDANKPGWWHRYQDVLPSWFRTAVGLEESASLIRAYEPQVVPGLLQTPDYVRAISTASFPSATDEETQRRVALRLARQELLTRPGAPDYWVVLEETVLRRPVGGPVVMRAQLAHLIEAAGRPNVTIQVIPFAAGWHPALYGMFWIFRFPGGEPPDVVYSEGLTSSYYLNKPEDTTKYTEALLRQQREARGLSRVPSPSAAVSSRQRSRSWPSLSFR
jgi:hypothetical protein